jgi:hypothetical protein
MHSNVNRRLFNWARVVARSCGDGVLVGYVRRDVRRISRKCQHRERDAYRTQFPNVRHDSLLDRFSLVAPIIIQVHANLLVSVRCKPIATRNIAARRTTLCAIRDQTHRSKMSTKEKTANAAVSSKSDQVFRLSCDGSSFPLPAPAKQTQRTEACGEE